MWKFNFNDSDLNKAVIYKIYDSNTPNHYYIGSAYLLKRRLITHKSNLKLHKHHSVCLQELYNSNIVLNVDIIEVINIVDNIYIKEQFYLDSLKPEYNTNMSASGGFITKGKFKNKEIQTIRWLFKMEKSMNAIGEFYDSNHQHMSNIINFRAYPHVEGLFEDYKILKQIRDSILGTNRIWNEKTLKDLFENEKFISYKEFRLRYNGAHQALKKLKLKDKNFELQIKLLKGNKKLIYYKNKYRTIKSLSDEYGIKPYIIRQRLNKKWDIKDLLKPVRPKQRRV